MYYRGETYICSAEVKDENGGYVDPSTITCTIYKPNGTQASTGAMTKDATGKYHYDFNLASDTDAGTWKSRVITTVAARTAISEIEFVVE